MTVRLDLTGERFGRWTVLGIGSIRHKRQGGTMFFWQCQCECGVIRNVRACHLRSGRTQSCGCLNRERVIARNTENTKHGHCVGRPLPPELYIYYAARRRCTNSCDRHYKDYGGRGIEFRFKSFQEFITEVGPRPSPELTLDRVDNDGHYEQGNLRWATPKEQASNRRPKPKGRQHALAAP